MWVYGCNPETNNITVTEAKPQNVLTKFQSVHLISGIPRGGVIWGVQTPPQNFEGPPKSCQNQPNCENC